MGYDEDYLNRRLGDCDPRSGINNDARTGVVIAWSDFGQRLRLRVKWNTGRETWINAKKVKDYCTSTGYEWLDGR